MLQYQGLLTSKHLFIHSFIHLLSSGTSLLPYLHYLIHKSLPFTLLLSILLEVSDTTTYAVAQAEIKESLQILSLCSPHIANYPTSSVGSISKTDFKSIHFSPSLLTLLTSWLNHLSSEVLLQFPIWFPHFHSK